MPYALHKYWSPATSLVGHKAPLKTDAINGIKSLTIRIIYFLLHHLHLNEYHAHIFFRFLTRASVVEEFIIKLNLCMIHGVMYERSPIW